MQRVLDDFIAQKAAHERTTGKPITDIQFLGLSLGRESKLRRREFEALAKRLAKDFSAARHRFGKPLRTKKPKQSQNPTQKRA
jgi:hypothetical protein